MAALPAVLIICGVILILIVAKTSFMLPAAGPAVEMADTSGRFSGTNARWISGVKSSWSSPVL